jgi:hypothetical protein
VAVDSIYPTTAAKMTAAFRPAVVSQHDCPIFGSGLTPIRLLMTSHDVLGKHHDVCALTTMTARVPRTHSEIIA